MRGEPEWTSITTPASGRELSHKFDALPDDAGCHRPREVGAQDQVTFAKEKHHLLRPGSEVPATLIDLHQQLSQFRY